MASDRVIVIVEPRTDLVRVVFPAFGSGGAVTVGGVAVAAGDVPAVTLAGALAPYLPAPAAVDAGTATARWGTPAAPALRFYAAKNSMYAPGLN